MATIESVGDADLQAAWSIGQDFAGQDFSIVDLTSFAVMLRLGLERAASFDDDFLVYRWGRAGRGPSTWCVKFAGRYHPATRGLP